MSLAEHATIRCSSYLTWRKSISSRFRRSGAKRI